MPDVQCVDFFFNLFIYFWLCWVFISVRGLSLVAASGGHSSSQCVGLSLSRPLLLRSRGSRRAGSVIVAHGPSHSTARGILPDQGSNPCPLHRQADSQPLCHQGSPNVLIFNYFRGRPYPVYVTPSWLETEVPECMWTLPNPLPHRDTLWGTGLKYNKMVTTRKTWKKSEKEESTVKCHTTVMLELDSREKRRRSPLLITTLFGVYETGHAIWNSLLFWWGGKNQGRVSKEKESHSSNPSLPLTPHTHTHTHTHSLLSH